MSKLGGRNGIDLREVNCIVVNASHHAARVASGRAHALVVADGGADEGPGDPWGLLALQAQGTTDEGQHHVPEGAHCRTRIIPLKIDSLREPSK